MARQINDQHYKSLTSHERFVLLVEAMARRDDAEADRLEATCPQYLYRAEDQAFRDRMRRAYMFASWVALGLEGPLAKIRLANSLHEHTEAFSGPVARLAQQAFLYGREYGKWETACIWGGCWPMSGTVRNRRSSEALSGWASDSCWKSPGI